MRSLILSPLVKKLAENVSEVTDFVSSGMLNLEDSTSDEQQCSCSSGEHARTQSQLLLNTRLCTRPRRLVHPEIYTSRYQLQARAGGRLSRICTNESRGF